MRKINVESVRIRSIKVFIFFFIGVFTAAPFLWICLLSAQDNPPYSILPSGINIEAYFLLFRGDVRTAFSGILYSLQLTIPATILGLFVAIAAVYLVISGMMPIRSRRLIVQATIGLYFLPAFAIHPGLRLLADIVPLFRVDSIQLLVMYTIQVFVMAFLLLLFLYSSSRKIGFEQLLLETGSRLTAFHLGIVSRFWIQTSIVAAICFSIVWSEFFLSALITTSFTGNKPFAVVLQMAMEQYRTNYNIFAAGAMLSIFISFLFFSIIALLTWFFTIRRVERRFHNA